MSNLLLEEAKPARGFLGEDRAAEQVRRHEAMIRQDQTQRAPGKYGGGARR